MSSRQHVGLTLELELRFALLAIAAGAEMTGSYHGRSDCRC
jgi:hypothetical protein